MNYSYIFLTSETFNKSAKKLLKKYSYFKNDLSSLKQILLKNPIEGIPLGQNCYKIRLKISSKNTGKSGGARVITYVKIEKRTITLLDVFDKADKESINEKDLSNLLKKLED